MLRIALIAVGGLLALAGSAAAQPIPPRAISLLENTMISGYLVPVAPGTQVGSEG
jgi:hypothetical protein